MENINKIEVFLTKKIGNPLKKGKLRGSFVKERKLYIRGGNVDEESSCTEYYYYYYYYHLAKDQALHSENDDITIIST